MSILRDSNTSLSGPPRLQEAEKAHLDFELHYDLSVQSVRVVLIQILEDLSSHRQLHNWDEKLATSPLKALRAIVHRYLSTNYHSSINILLSHATVHEVITVDGVNKIRPAIQEAGDIYSHLFFSKLPAHCRSRESSFSALNDPDGAQKMCSNATTRLPFAQGRIVNIKEQIPYFQRAALLILHAFCARLQYENYAFIQGFIERHLSLRSAYKAPDRLQVIYPQEIDASKQKCYKRVTLSSHIPYLVLDNRNVSHECEVLIDRLIICPFRPHKRTGESSQPYLFKTSSSVLLTIVLPEESQTHEEEIGLLTNPQALWTVLIVNGPTGFALDAELPEHLSPCAQYLRGITASLYTQRTHAQHILGVLIDHLSETDNDTLFDDEMFTKSELYHWVIKICHELCGSLASNLRSIEKVLDGQINHLCDKAHGYENLGISYWLRKMKEEVYELDKLQTEIHMLREKVQESRNALHGATAVLEARIAFQQGERMKTLTYLATAYLPLTSVASLYSMSVLPHSATFLSFFVVVSIFFLLTLLLGVNLSKLSTAILSTVPNLRGRLNIFLKPLFWTRSYARSYLDALMPREDEPSVHMFCYNLMLCGGIRNSFIALIRGFLIPEILLPYALWNLFLLRHNKYIYFWWSPVLFTVHVIRIALIPAWATVLTGMILCLVSYDILSGCCCLISRTLPCRN